MSFPTVPLKSVTRLNPETLGEDTNPDQEYSYAEISDVTLGEPVRWQPPTRFESLPSRARRVVRNGDVVVSTVRTYLRAVARVDGAPKNSIVSTGFAVFQPLTIEPRFLGYALQETHFVDAVVADSVGVSYPAVNASDVARLHIPSPSFEKQRQIADYLDHETAEIDAFIADQEELIVLLTERRRSAAAHVLSGVDRARRVRLRFLFDQSREDNSVESQVLSVYRDYGVIPKSSRADNFNKTPEDVSRYLVVRPGYLVVNKMKAWQGSLGVSVHDGIVSPDYDVLRPRGDLLLSTYAHAYLRGPRMVAEYAARSVGVRPSQWRLYWEQLRDIAVPVPSIESQSEAVRQLDRETEALDAAIADARMAIALSKERRVALITAAVTGQIDVTARQRPVVDSIQSVLEEAR